MKATRHAPDTAPQETFPETRVVPYGLIKPNEHNPRTISEENFRKLVRSIIDFPEMLYYRPLVCVTHPDSFYRPLGGNMRLQAIPKAIEELSLNASLYERAQHKLELLSRGVPILLADDWSMERRDEFIIKDNVAFGEWNWEVLANNFDIKVLDDWGLKPVEWKVKEKNLEARQDTYHSSPPAHPRTIVGDIYECNGHRLSCGSSTDRFAVTALMAGTRANLCVTSPPYWVGKDYEYQDSEEQIDVFIRDIADGISLAVGEDMGRVVINTGSCSIHRIDRKRPVEVLPLIDKWIEALRPHGWLLRHVRIWLKGGSLPASISPRTDIIANGPEDILLFTQGDDTYERILTFYHHEGERRGQERLGTKWAQQPTWGGAGDEIVGEKSTLGHNAAFPVEIPARNILLYTRRREVVYEPFCGSGTTLLACEQLDRRCYAQELSPGWCDVTVKRWVAWMLRENLPFKVLRNGRDISDDPWLLEP